MDDYRKGVQFQVSIKLDIDELRKVLKPEQIVALMEGMGKVLAVQKDRKREKKPAKIQTVC